MQISVQADLARRLRCHPHQIAKESKSNFIRSFFFLNPLKRRALEAVYAFARVLDDAVDEWPSTALQHEALQFWETHFREALAGRPTGLLFTELMWAIATFQIPSGHFKELIRGCRSDITKHRYTTFAELESYCYDVASTVGLICLPIFGIHDPRALAPSIALGKALQLTNIIRDVYEDFQRDRIYLPLDDFERFGYDPNDIGNKRYTPAFRALMQFEAERAQIFFTAANQFLQHAPSSAYLAPRLMGQTYLAILNEIKRRDFQVFEQKIGLSNWQKLRLFLGTWIK